MLRILLVCVAAIAVLLGYILYYPMPPEVTDPLTTTLVMAPMSIINFVARIQYMLGYGSFAENARFWKNLQAPKPPTPGETDGVKISLEKLVGLDVVFYRPIHLQGKAPATVYIHGGGWVFHPPVYEQHVIEYAKRSNSVVIYVDYRLAPEHPFPAAFDDCIDVTRHILQHGDKYGVDNHNVGVAGDSAGGNLAAAVSLALTRETPKLPALRYQVLYVPVLQAFDFRNPSKIDMDMPVLTAKSVAAFVALYFGLEGEDLNDHVLAMIENRHIPADLKTSKFAKYVDTSYLPQVYQTPRKTLKKVTKDFDGKLYEKIKDILFDPRFAPLMADDLSGLPPAFIWASEADVLRDDGIMYGHRLDKAGVEARLRVVKGASHLSYLIQYEYSEELKSAQREVFKFVREHLGNE